MLPSDAPAQVLTAFILLWVSVALGTVDALYTSGAEFSENIVAAIAVLAVIVAIESAIICLAARRHNWARWALLAWFIAALCLYSIDMPDQIAPWWDVVILVGSFLSEAIGLFILFTGSGARWYARAPVQ